MSAVCLYDRPHAAVWCPACSEAEEQGRKQDTDERIATALESLAYMLESSTLTDDSPAPRPRREPRPRWNPGPVQELGYQWRD